jgi:hypothetical protein
MDDNEHNEIKTSKPYPLGNFENFDGQKKKPKLFFMAKRNLHQNFVRCDLLDIDAEEDVAWPRPRPSPGRLATENIA